MAVYDDQKPKTDEDLNSLTGISKAEEGDIETRALAGADQDKAATKDSGKSKALDAGQLGDAESNAHDQIGSGFSNNDRGGALSRVRTGFTSRGGKRAAAGGGIIAGIAAFFIFIFLALLPLKLNHIVQNLQDKFFATSESAIQRQTDNLMDTYIQKHVLPGIKGTCTTRNINKDCVSQDITGNSKASKLFRAWKDTRLENKLATNYGIEFYKSGPKYYIKTPQLSGGVDIEDFAEGKVSHLDDIQQVNRSDFRRLAHEGMEHETKWKRMVYRFKVGRLLEKKYGIKRCAIACNTRDKLADWVDDKHEKVSAAKVLIVQRVVEPRTETFGIVLECVISSSCDPNSIVDHDGPNGEGRSATDKQIQEKLVELSDKYGAEAVTNVIKDASTITEKGFTRYLVEKIVSKVASDSASKAASDAVPYVGALNTAASYVEAISGAGGKLKKLAYETNAASMVATFALYRSHADEIKSGKVNADLAGSFVSSLGSNTKNGEPAENNPLYAKLIDNAPGTSQTSLLDTISTQTAYAADAATEPKTSYTCDNGKPIPAGQQVCAEESLTVTNLITEVSALFTDGPLKPIKVAADAWNASIGKGFNWFNQTIGEIFAKVPGVQQLGNTVASFTQPIFDMIAQYLIPSAVSDTMSGGRTFSLIAGGADVAGNYFAHTGLGGQSLTPQQATAIQDEYLAQAKQSFDSQSFFARMFDTDSQYSLASKVAMALPSDTNGALQSAASNIIRAPFSTIFSSFSTLFTGRSALAAPDEGDPFGVTQYGYPSNDPVFTTDPETLTDDYCKQLTDKWNQNTTTNPITNEQENTTTNPCLLNDAAVGASGGYLDSSLLTPDDLDQSTSTPTTPSIPTGNPGDCPSAPVPIDQTIVVQGVRVHTCIAAKVDALITAAAAGGIKLGGGGWRDNNNQIALRIAHGCGGSRIYDRSCRGSPPTAVPGTSRHERGTAIDFTCNGKGTISSHSSPCFVWLAANASNYGLYNLPSESWHWSVDGH